MVKMFNRQYTNTVLTIYRYYGLQITDLSIFNRVATSCKKVLSTIVRAQFAASYFFTVVTKYIKSTKL